MTRVWHCFRRTGLGEGGRAVRQGDAVELKREPGPREEQQARAGMSKTATAHIVSIRGTVPPDLGERLARIQAAAIGKKFAASAGQVQGHEENQGGAQQPSRAPDSSSAVGEEPSGD